MNKLFEKWRCFTLLSVVLFALASPVTAQTSPVFQINEQFCRTCHQITVDFHHILAQERGLPCLGCHGPLVQTPRGLFEFPVIRDCLRCHGSSPHAISCRLCHRDRRFEDFIGRGREIHEEHKDRVVCGICHAIPETISFGPRDRACGNLCHGPERIQSPQQIHEEHMGRFDKLPNPCQWCHGKKVPERPPLARICTLCHSSRTGGRQVAHDRHARRFDCSACHVTVAGFPDVRFTSRSLVCTVCHEPESGGAREIHEEHVFGEAQCYACHGDSDVYATFRGEKDCTICHSSRTDPFFEIHEEHAGEGMMCAVCHPLMRPDVQGVRLSAPGSAGTSPSGNRPPVAFAGNDQTVATGSVVFLSASGSKDIDGSIVSYRWDFGDGGKGTGMTASHRYSRSGTYTVTLDVTDNDGASTVDQVLIRVSGP